MNWEYHLKIPKKLKQLSFWVHPEGRVIGSIFLNLHNKNYTGGELVIDAINHEDPFIVLKREDPEEIRFYNKCAIVRAEYEIDDFVNYEGVKPLHCRVSMMDGSVIDGIVMKQLPPNNARLYDYLNANNERFAEFHVGGGQVCAVNKSYIACVTPLGELRLEEIKWLEDEFTTSTTIL
jgi:hypothetical protein